MSVQGLVSDIQRYCLHDGPGIRTVIFIKSCPLSCLWCANPESQRSHPELMLSNATCLACDECITACPQDAITLITSTTQLTPDIDWPRCDACLACVEVCPTGTLTQVGVEYALEEIMAIVRLDEVFYARSNGGVTLSGGEPTAQPDFSRSILQSCKQHGIHTAIETCGACEWESLRSLIPFTDLIYFDLKHIDPHHHAQFTGISNDQILENLSRLIQHHDNLIVRMPLIPGHNDGDDHLINLAAHLNSLKSQIELELIPFHHLGSGKYHRLGRIYPFEDVKPIEPEYQHEREQFIRSYGLRMR